MKQHIPEPAWTLGLAPAPPPSGHTFSRQPLHLSEPQKHLSFPFLPHGGEGWSSPGAGPQALRDGPGGALHFPGGKWPQDGEEADPAPREFLLHNIVIQYFYTFETDCHEQSSHHLSLYKDITQLLTPFPTLHTSPRASFILQSRLLPLSSVSCLYTDQNLFVLCLKLCFCFAVFIRFTCTVKSYGICLSLSDLFF